MKAPRDEVVYMSKVKNNLKGTRHTMSINSVGEGSTYDVCSASIHTQSAYATATTLADGNGDHRTKVFVICEGVGPGRGEKFGDWRRLSALYRSMVLEFKR
jgi:hypothetical protein